MVQTRECHRTSDCPERYGSRFPKRHLQQSHFDQLPDRDRIAHAKVVARIRRAELGNFGDVAPVGSGVSEMRIHFGPGYRVYFKQVGMEIYVLLAAGDKGSQAADIKTALEMARQIGE